MTEPSRTTTPETARFSLLDVAALIVGYGLASLLIRAYWPKTGQPSVWAVGMIALVFSWLGLAMSGPVVLLIRRPQPLDPEENENPEPRTWAELAWMIIGFYWIGLTVLVVPSQMNGMRILDSAVLGVFPILAALFIWYVGPRSSWVRPRPRPGHDGPTWTHRAAIALLCAWPFAWVGLIALGKSLP